MLAFDNYHTSKTANGITVLTPGVAKSDSIDVSQMHFGTCYCDVWKNW